MDWALHLRRIFARLGEDATFTHAGGQPVSVRGLFTAPYALLPSGLDGGMSCSQPRFAAMDSDLGTASQGDTLVRNATTYTVVEVQPDAPGGFTILQLQEP